MEKIYDWSARRAGGRITITGKTEDGNPRKLTGVDQIQPRAGGVVAIDKDSKVYELVI